MSTESPETPVITYEPFTYYSATVVCRTEGCPRQGIVVSIPMMYSNGGDADDIYVQDSACGKWMTILTATKRDPQPPEE